MPSNLICCTTTTGAASDADRIAEQLLNCRLVACVQVQGPIRSHYRWNGTDHCDEEFRLTIKSSVSVWHRLKAKLVEIHPYDEPQIVMFPISDSTTGYQQWVLNQLDE